MKQTLKQKIVGGIVGVGIGLIALFGGCEESQKVLTPEERAKKEAIALQVSQQLTDIQRQKEAIALQVSQQLTDIQRQQQNVQYPPQQNSNLYYDILTRSGADIFTNIVTGHYWLNQNK